MNSREFQLIRNHIFLLSGRREPTATQIRTKFLRPAIGTNLKIIEGRINPNGVISDCLLLETKVEVNPNEVNPNEEVPSKVPIAFLSQKP